MARKVNATFTAELNKNQEKGGAWLAGFSILHEGIDAPIAVGVSAWSNASAGKRWVKEMVLKHTPRKSVKMVANDKVDAKGKPVYLVGTLNYKADA